MTRAKAAPSRERSFEWAEGCWFRVTGPFAWDDNRYHIDSERWHIRAGEYSVALNSPLAKRDTYWAACAYAMRMARAERAKADRMIARGGLYGPDGFMLDFSYDEMTWVKWTGSGYEKHAGSL